MNDDAKPCTVYGDEQTCTELRTEVRMIAASVGLFPAAWYQDPKGLRGAPSLAALPGLAAGLAHCAATGTPMLIAFEPDAPGEQRIRLIAHWLHLRGLRLCVGPCEVFWDRPTDELDFAIRAQLDAASDLAISVALAGALPDLDELAADLLRGPLEPAGRALLAEIRRVAEACSATGRPAPLEPDPRAGWQERERQVIAWAQWLNGWRSQRYIAAALNEVGALTRRGRPWTPQAVGRLLRAARAADSERRAA